MRRWIAYENDAETGIPTDAFVVVMADTRADATRNMADAITVHSNGLARAERARLWAIFIEAVTELAEDDPRAGLVSSPDRAVFAGFDQPRERRPPPPRYRGRQSR